jgi:NAD(P)-dependent dehydrogenase (short-subunit alcohol dehydrogenase family)
MHRSPQILITGGTSGLGLELVKVYLRKGYQVTALGRDPSQLPGGDYMPEFAYIDFGDLKESARIIKDLCRTHHFDYVINNAGILSPPDYTTTKDGFECTFQINFLTHLLINEVIIQSRVDNFPIMIAAVTSPVHRLPGNRKRYVYDKSGYTPLKAYSDSKFLLSLMCRHLSIRELKRNVKAFSFDPGVFRSGIYRIQKPWFRMMYRIAAPFMRSPGIVAEAFAEILEFNNIETGKVYDLRKRVFSLSGSDSTTEKDLWNYCYEKISPFLNLRP